MTLFLSRRFFLAGVAAAALFPPRLAFAADEADTIYAGGTVITIDDAKPRAEAVAVKDGRILAVGATDEVMAHKGPSTKMVDLDGRTMVPGFVDPHGHIVLGGLQALSANLLAPPDGGVTDIASLQQTLRDWVERNAEAVKKVQLIVGFGYDNAQLKELRHPTRDDLDQVSSDIPIVVVHQSGHLAAVNSKALQQAGVTAATENPPGGVIRRRQGSQEPDGVLEETAMAGIVLPLMSSIGPEGFKEFARSGASLWARYGYTTAQEGRATPQVADIVRAVADEGGFRNDVAIYVDVQASTDYILKHRSKDYVNRVRVAGGKLSLDGSPQGFTALRDRPYYAPIGTYPPGYSGYATVPMDEAVRLVDWSFANNVHLLTHANGEGASDMLIAALRAAEASHGAGDRRPVLIHGQFMREDQVDSYKALNVVPSLFPMHTFYWGDWHREHTVGPIAADNISPTGWVRERGMIFTTHHDAPVALPDSMRVLDATVTRRTRSGDILGPAQRVDVLTGLKAMTLWAAYQQFEDHEKGSIEPGKLADLVILSADPTEVDPDTIDQIRVTETIKDGETIFSLSPEEVKKGELMLPGGTGDIPFQRFLNKAALYRDIARSGRKPLSRAFMRAMAEAPHDYGCVTRLLDDMVASVKL